MAVARCLAHERGVVSGGITLRLQAPGTTEWVWAHTLGYGQVSDVEIQHRYSSTGGGLHLVSFSLALPRGYTHPALVQGTKVRVEKSGERLGTAILADPDRAAWSFVADGLYRQAEFFNAENILNAKTTTSPLVAVRDGNDVSRGLGWNGTGNLPNFTLSADSEELAETNTVAQVLDYYAKINGKRWGLTAANVPYFADDPTSATVFLRPGTPAMATTSDDYATRITVRYVSAVNAGTSPPTPTAWSIKSATSANTSRGVREEWEDVTNLGLVTALEAQNLANNLLATRVATRRYTEAIEPATGQLTWAGGVPVAPWQNITGRRLRQFGVLDSDGANQYGQTAEWVVGSTTWRPADGTFIVAPVDLAAATTRSVQEATRRDLIGSFS